MCQPGLTYWDKGWTRIEFVLDAHQASGEGLGAGGRRRKSGDAQIEFDPLHSQLEVEGPRVRRKTCTNGADMPIPTFRETMFAVMGECARARWR